MESQHLILKEINSYYFLLTLISFISQNKREKKQRERKVVFEWSRWVHVHVMRCWVHPPTVTLAD